MLDELVHQRLWPDEPEWVHAQLGRVILERERASPGLRVANVGGWHSEPDLQTWRGAAIAALLDRVRTQALALGGIACASRPGPT